MANELLDPKYWSVKQVFDYEYYIPVYQRPYSWQADQIDALLEDIYASFEEFYSMPADDRFKAGLYLGNIIVHTRALNQFDIIDGQQRITTFALLLLALYSYSIELGAEPNERLIQKLQGALWTLDAEDNPIKEKRSITLGSVDKNMMKEVFDAAFDSPKTLKKYFLQYETKNSFEDNIKDNYLRIFDSIVEWTSQYKEKIKYLLLLSNFILSKIYLISIITIGSEVKAFSIFESINSKGKKLEDIDLMKTYIFSKLPENKYAEYLSKWGTLITKTNDDLYGYLKIYIRAYVKYYSQNISFANFKKLDDELCAHFNSETAGEAFMSLIDDMIDKVDYFKALTDLDDALAIVKDNKFKFYYLLYLKIGYEHPKPLFFRSFAEYSSGKLSKEDLITVFIETIKTMVSFLTIAQKDSKDIINAFSSIFSSIYDSNKVDKNLIIYRLNSKLQTTGIRYEDLFSALSQLDLYEKNKKLGAAVISLYESKQSDNDKFVLSWDEAFSKLSTFGSSYSLDHIMNQTPERNDPNLKYYQLGNNLKLKEGHDFPLDIIHDGMEYATFKSLILHVAGNLRLKGLDGNSSRGNESESNFCTYASLKKRNTEIVEFVLDNFLDLEKVPDDYNPDVQQKGGKTRLVGNFDFSMEDLDLTGARVKRLEIFDRSYEISHNKDIIKYLVMYFYEQNETEIISMAENNWGSRKRTVISWDKSKLISPFEIIKNKVYVETNLSSRDILWYAKDLLNKFSFPLDLVVIYIPE